MPISRAPLFPTMTKTHALTKLDLIRGAAKALAFARARLAKSVAALTGKVEAAHRRHLPGIRQHVNAVADTYANLRTALGGAPELFIAPRTITESGIKCGYQAHDRSLDLPNGKAPREALVATIRKLWKPAEISALGLLATVETPVAEKLLEFATPAQIEELVKCGATFTPAGDHLLVKPADGAVDKLVAKLLKAAADSDEEKAG